MKMEIEAKIVLEIGMKGKAARQEKRKGRGAIKGGKTNMR